MLCTVVRLMMVMRRRVLLLLCMVCMMMRLLLGIIRTCRNSGQAAVRRMRVHVESLNARRQPTLLRILIVPSPAPGGPPVGIFAS